MQWVEQLYPATKEGFIDEKQVYQLAYITLSLPLGALDDITPYQLSWLLEGHYTKEREWFELLNHTITISVASANSGKKIPLFAEAKNEPKQQVKKKFNDVEEKQRELDALKELF